MHVYILFCMLAKSLCCMIKKYIKNLINYLPVSDVQILSWNRTQIKRTIFAAKPAKIIVL